MFALLVLGLIGVCALIYAVVRIGADAPWICSCGTKMDIVENVSYDGMHTYFGRCPECGAVTPAFQSLEKLREYEEGL